MCVIILPVNIILIKYVLDFTDYWTVFAYVRIGVAIATIPIVYFYLPELIKSIKEFGAKVIIVMSISKGLFLFGSLLLTIALSFGYASLVYSLSSIQPFFVLLIAVILSRFFPSILKEEVSKSIVLVKIIAIISIFIGAFLIT